MKKHFLSLLILLLLLTGCSPTSSDANLPESGQSVTSESSNGNVTVSNSESREINDSSAQIDGYRIISVDGGELSGRREANVAVDIGYGDREYWAFTNEYGQLIKVIAKEIVLQDDSTEPVTADGRYYNDEAEVPGTELDNYDQGHILADSLGGVSNAYNITPQESTLNRNGNQAYMERTIRDAGGCIDFEAIITYPDTKTQIPSHYRYTYTLLGNVIVDDFDNVNPDNANEDLIEKQKAEAASSPAPTSAPTASGGNGISSVDANGNGQVTISEAKAAGYSMPITSNHWLYPFMDDRNGDGMVGE